MPAGTFGDWGKASARLGSAKVDLRAATRLALVNEANVFRSKVLTGLRKQAPSNIPFKPLAATTIAMRRFFGFRGTKALLKRGDLRNAIAVVTVSDTMVFAGVLRTARSAKGNLFDLARLNEEGSKPIIIKITPQMRALLHMAFRRFGATNRMGWSKASTGIIVVQIPARPFLRPVYEDMIFDMRKTARRFAGNVRRYLNAKGKIW